MTTEQKRWTRRVRDVRRREPDLTFRQVFIADWALALVLTVLAIFALTYADPEVGPQRVQNPLLESLRLHPTTPADRTGSVGPSEPLDPPTPPEPPGLPGFQPPSDLRDPPPGEASPAGEPIPGDDFPYPLLAALTTLPLALRRRYPLSMFWVVLTAALMASAVTTWITVMACAIAAYSAVAHGANRVAAVAGLLVASVPAGAVFAGVAPGLPSWLGPFFVLVSAGAFAGMTEIWRHRVAVDKERIAVLHYAQEEAKREAVREERARIAAELHDVVTHNVSVMVIQAGAARAVLAKEPEGARQALLAVESGGRAALAELRHVMGLLSASDTGTSDTSTSTNGASDIGTSANGATGDRASDDEAFGERASRDRASRERAAGDRASGGWALGDWALGVAPPRDDDLEPQPGLDRLDALIGRVRAAGVSVGTDVSLPSEPFAPGVELAAYRVVQEALTNTIKHAAGASASVRINHTDDRLAIEVTDTGGPPRTQTQRAAPQSAEAQSAEAQRAEAQRAATQQLKAGGGRGLIGLRERLRVYGGTLDAGPVEGGGYRLQATIPRRDG